MEQKDCIALARSLGKAIQSDECYRHLQQCIEQNETSEQLQAKMERFAVLRKQGREALKRKDKEAVLLLDKEMKSAYDEILEMPEMKLFTAAQEKFQKKYAFILQILEGSVNGYDPEQIKYVEECKHDCSTCSGCQ